MLNKHHDEQRQLARKGRPSSQLIEECESSVKGTSSNANVTFSHGNDYTRQPNPLIIDHRLYRGLGEWTVSRGLLGMNPHSEVIPYLDGVIPREESIFMSSRLIQERAQDRDKYLIVPRRPRSSSLSRDCSAGRVLQKDVARRSPVGGSPPSLDAFLVEVIGDACRAGLHKRARVDEDAHECQGPADSTLDVG